MNLKFKKIRICINNTKNLNSYKKIIPELNLEPWNEFKINLKKI